MFYIKPSEILPEKCVISTGSGLFCDKWSAAPGQLDLKLKNSLDEALTITSDSMIYESSTGNCTPSSSVQIAAGGTGSISFNSGTNCGTLTASGEKVQADISLRIMDTDGFNKTAAGTLIVKVP